LLKEIKEQILSKDESGPICNENPEVDNINEGKDISER
jgi:hypothetical protein